jgi:hypothetical protein
MDSFVARAADALRLRAWALSTLAQGWRGAAPPACGALAWDLFLGAEACALPLATCLGEAGFHELPPDASSALHTRTSLEQRQFLSARGQARLLARHARETGNRVVVLKGGVAAAAGQPQVGMLDLDVFAPDGAEALAKKMDGLLGYAPAGAGEGGHHLPVRLSEGALGVEVHRSLKEFPAGGRDLEFRPLGADGLLALAPEHHAWHLLVHGTVSHRDRRGRLRELVLLADARGRCSDDEWARVRARADAHPAARLLACTMDAAAGLWRGAAPSDPAPLEAAGRYLVALRVPALRLPRRARRDLVDATFSLLNHGREYRGMWSTALSAPAPGAWAPLAPRRAWRAARLAAVSPVALLLARDARRAAAAAAAAD